MTMTRRPWQCWGQSLRSTLSAWPTHAHGAALTVTLRYWGWHTLLITQQHGGLAMTTGTIQLSCLLAHVRTCPPTPQPLDTTSQYTQHGRTRIQCLCTSVVSVFVHIPRSEDVREAREFLDGLGLQHCRVLAKIETRQSLLNFRGILSTADGIIVSRYTHVRERMGPALHGRMGTVSGAWDSILADGLSQQPAYICDPGICRSAAQLPTHA